MNDNDIIEQAEYADIIITLLKPPYEIESITKLIFISFCIKHQSNISVYSHRTKDFIDVFFSNISVKLSTHYYDIEHILYAIDLLNKTSKLLIDGDKIKLNYTFNFCTENRFLKFCNAKHPNPIIEINKLGVKALVEEVIRYV